MQSVPITRSARPETFRPTRVCIELADRESDTCRVAEAVAARLTERGFAAEIFRELRSPLPRPDAFVLGASAARRSLLALARFVASARAELVVPATAMFLVRHRRKHDAVKDISEAVTRLDWRPDLVAALDAAEPHHGALVRWVIHHVRPHREWSVTSDTDALRFADAIAVGLTRAGDLHLLPSSR